MPFSALIDDEPVHLAGADSEDVWQRAQQAKRDGRIRCRGCGGEMRTRSGKNTVRHFFHKVKPDSCLLGGGEGATHLRTKMALAAAIEASGGKALVEHIATDRSFVVDVLGVWPAADQGVYRVAFEVQVSQQTEEVTAERTAQRAGECDQTVWVLMRHPMAEGWPVEGLGLPHWSANWADRWPSFRLDHDLTIAGLVAHQADGTRPRWRETDPASLVTAIGTGKAVWVAQSVHSGWVTPALRAQIADAFAVEARAAAAREAKEEQRRVNAERFAERQRTDLAALRKAFISQGIKPETVRHRQMHAHGQPLRVKDVDYLVLPSAWQISTPRCRDFINAHVVVANYAGDRRRLADKGIKAMTVAEATSPETLAAAQDAAKKRLEALEKQERRRLAARAVKPSVRAAKEPEAPKPVEDVGERRKAVRQELVDALGQAGVPFRVPYGPDTGTVVAGDLILRVLPQDDELSDSRKAKPIYILRHGIRRAGWHTVEDAVARAADTVRPAR